MSLTLYEIGQEFTAVEQAIIEAEGEITPEIEDRLKALGDLEAQKLDAYRAVVLNFERHAGNCHDEAQILQQKAAAAKASASRLKDWLKRYMEAKGVTELKGEIFKAAIQGNGGKQAVTVLVPVENLDRTLCRITVEPDTEKLRERMQDGVVTDLTGTVVAKLEPKGTHLRFR